MLPNTIRGWIIAGALLTVSVVLIIMGETGVTDKVIQEVIEFLQKEKK